MYFYALCVRHMTIQHQHNRAFCSTLHDCDEMIQPRNEQFFVKPSFAALNKDASWRSTALEKFGNSFSWENYHRRHIHTRCADATHTHVTFLPRSALVTPLTCFEPLLANTLLNQSSTLNIRLWHRSFCFRVSFKSWKNSFTASVVNAVIMVIEVG